MAHNSTLESISALGPRSLADLATIKGVGPAFVTCYGEQVLALVGEGSWSSASFAARGRRLMRASSRRAVTRSGIGIASSSSIGSRLVV